MWPVWAQLELLGRTLFLTGYGVFAILGAIVATCLCVRGARRLGFPAFDAFAASALAVTFGLVGAKVFFLIVSLPRLREEGLGSFLAHGGLVWYGGVVGGGAATIAYLRGYRLDVARFADAAASALAVGHALGRLGCFMAGCCYGRPTTLPWGVRFPPTPFFDGPVGVALHPVQLYEAAVELGLAFAARMAGGRLRSGGGMAVWLTGYGAARLVMEVAFRGDDRGLGLLGWPPSVAISLAMVTVGVGILARPGAGLTTEKIVS